MTTSSDLMADSNNVASLCSRRVSVVGVMSLPECRSCGQVPGRVRVNISTRDGRVAKFLLASTTLRHRIFFCAPTLTAEASTSYCIADHYGRLRQRLLCRRRRHRDQCLAGLCLQGTHHRRLFSARRTSGTASRMMAQKRDQALMLRDGLRYGST